MKKLFITTLGILLLSQFSFGQKFGYIDSQLILEKMPAYQAAQKEIDVLSDKWQKELEGKYKEIEQLYADYQAEEVLLPADIKQQRQDEIFAKEREAKEFKNSKFGYDGELFSMQDEKVKPVQDLIYEAVEGVAKEKRLDFIFDKSANTGIIYSNGNFDRTDDVMNKLGIAR